MLAQDSLPLSHLMTSMCVHDQMSERALLQMPDNDGRGRSKANVAAKDTAHALELFWGRIFQMQKEQAGYSKAAPAAGRQSGSSCGNCGGGQEKVEPRHSEEGAL